jgi:adenylylsulfate kinase
MVLKTLKDQNVEAEVLDGDVIRSQSPIKLGFSREDREKNQRYIAGLAQERTSAGIIPIVATIAPYRHLRNEFRARLSPFLEVFVNAPLNVCEQRDVKGLYRRHCDGELKQLTGVDDVYEPPLAPDVECRTDLETIEESAAKIFHAVNRIISEGRSEQKVNRTSIGKRS